MAETQALNYFLGANSASGFYSLYEDFCRPEQGNFLWVIKGGPGCGKSSFMKRIGAAAQAAGQEVHYIWCSGDPESLDAVYIPGWKTGYVDGTAPHVTEVVCPGAGGLYLDLGRFYDRTALTPRLPELLELNRLYKAIYQDAYRLLSVAEGAADALRGDSCDELPLLSATGGEGTVSRRFARALSCQGLVSYENQYAYAQTSSTHADLSRLAVNARSLGHNVILILHPLLPRLTEAVLLPDAGLAFRIGHTEADVLFAKPMESACRMFARAKTLHDQLEAVYNPHVDFEGVYELAQRHIEKLAN